MIAKYCLPIIKTTKQEVLQALNTKGYDFYEVWLDYIKDLDEKFVVSLAKKFKGKMIFVFRRQNLEPTKLTTDRKQDLISLLSKFGVFLDLDFLTQQEELDFLRQKNSKMNKFFSSKIKLILSYHNYKETPSLNYLENLIDKMVRYKPDIFKVSTFCQREEDSLNLLNLLFKLKEQRLKYIVLGMGQKGLITRIFGTLWGNEMIFAPKEKDEQSAPGQLTKDELKSIFDILGKYD